MKRHNGHPMCPEFDARCRLHRRRDALWLPARAAAWANTDVRTVFHWLERGWIQPIAHQGQLLIRRRDVMRLYVYRSLAGSIRALPPEILERIHA